MFSKYTTDGNHLNNNIKSYQNNSRNMCFGEDRIHEKSVSSCAMGMLLPDQTYEEHGTSQSKSTCSVNDILDEIDDVQVEKTLAAFRKYDEFLKRYGIRPEFFCKHREKLALETWLIQKSSRRAQTGERKSISIVNLLCSNRKHSIQYILHKTYFNILITIVVNSRYKCRKVSNELYCNVGRWYC